MPVRIYDIAKKLGITNKEVLARAKEIGIVNARVASSTLDKITAEYLEQQIGGALEAKTVEPAAEPPAEEKGIVIVTAPPEEKPAEETTKREASTDSSKQPSEAEVPADALPSAADEEISLPKEEQPESGEAEADIAFEEEASTGKLEEDKPVDDGGEETEQPGLGAKIGFIRLTKGLQGRPRPEDRIRERQRRRNYRKNARAAADREKSARNVQAAESQTAKKPTKKPKYVAPSQAKLLSLKQPIIVRDLAKVLNRKSFQLIADLMELNVFATVNQAIEEFTAKEICAKYGFRFEIEKRERGAGVTRQQDSIDLDVDDKESDLVSRPPVVTIMGHVDHGKTTLLDVIRKSNVVSREAGGITQHIGAYTIHFPHPDNPGKIQQITFLDTPGHAAFSSMRARGANVTDLVILVVAANDGVKPQTIEALNHAKAAQVPIIVAVNKIDLPGAVPSEVRNQLQDLGLVCEEWGGDTIFVDISALNVKGIDTLLEMVLLQSEVLELRANPNRPAVGNVIESGMQPGGPIATVLVRKGTLKVGDAMLCGAFWGRVKALINEDGKRFKEALPSVAVRVLGLNGAPEAGLEFNILPNEKQAKKLAEERALQTREEASGKRNAVTLENLFDSLSSTSAKLLRVVVKADTQGSVEAIVESLKKIESKKVNLEVIHSGIGSLNESDVMLASASNAVLIGFHTRLDAGVSDIAKREKVQIKLYAVIYELIDEVREAMAGLLDPITKDRINGVAEIRKIFEMSKGGRVAGCVISQGKFERGKVRVYRNRNMIYEGTTQSLRRFQDEVNEVRAGMECGVRIDRFNDFQEGDTIESYSLEEIAQEL